MTLPAARVTDLTTHGTPALPGTGSINVIIGNLLAWRTNIDIHICPIPIAPPAPAPHGPEICYKGSTTVLINNQMACRLGDILQGAGPPNPFAMGEPTVLIGDVGFGMASPSAMGGFAAAMANLQNQWESLSPEERLNHMEDAINASLSENMPPITIVPTDLDEGTNGEFDFEDWQINIDNSLLEGDMTEDRMAALTNTLYHEGRHGEQWFNAAQYRAANGESAEDLYNNTGIQQHVADAAVANPANVGTSEHVMGQSVDTSVYGDRSSYRENVYSDDSAEAYDQYRALPEEEDAFQQGDAAEEIFRNLP